jgi:hypothetical protein
MNPFVNMTDVMNEIFGLSKDINKQKAALGMAMLALKKITMAEDADINCLSDAIIVAQSTLEAINNIKKGKTVEPWGTAS